MRVKAAPESETESMAESFLSGHRGPYRLLLGRPHPKAGKAAAGFSTSEWAQGLTEGPDVAEEAQSLLTDPRDTVDMVHVWSEREECFVGGYRNTDYAQPEPGTEPGIEHAVTTTKEKR